jgi:hypothetical protein
MPQAIVFVSICPTCKREQAQDRFTARDLVKLLKGNLPIEAYCPGCDEFWSVSIQQRVDLREVVAFTPGGGSLFNRSRSSGATNRALRAGD